MKRLRRWFVVAVLLAGLGAALGIAALDTRVRTYLAGPPLGGARVYATPAVLRGSGAVPGGSLPRLLARLGYRPAETGMLAPGEFRAEGSVVELAQRPSPVPWADAPRRVRVTLRGARVAELANLDGGAPLDRLELEPEMLAVLGGEGPTLEAGEDVAPDACRAAVLAAEDRWFFRHPGIDPVAIVRALVVDLRLGTAAQGGSTITQQLVKNAFLSPRRTLRRKVQEAVLAVLLEVHTTKEEILRRYLDVVYLGNEGGLPVHGFAQAAEVFFGKALGELDVGQCALLAGMIRSPNRLAPRRHARAATARRNQVLALMVNAGLVDETAALRATAAPITLAPPRSRAVGALYVAAQVERSLRALLPPEVADAPGLSIFTGVDAEMQREAERAVRRGLDELERGRKRREPLQAALVALDPPSGRVRALVGGRDYGASQLDRAVRARRQPGSAFKPFVYLAALDPARRETGAPLTVMSPIEDTPVELRVGARMWRPANYDGTFAGVVPVEDALAESRNAATVRVALDVGIDAVAQAAMDLGLRGPLPHVPALALGVAETSLLDLTAAYGVFASGGVRRPPVLVVAVSSATGETLYAAPEDEAHVIASGLAYLVTHLLEQVFESGTARSARDLGLRGTAAGKTGTTDDTRDAWFVGYTPEVVAGVWVGMDGGGATGLTGAQGALPIWVDFVRATAGPDASRNFPVPDDVVWREVDPASGHLATPGCPERREEPFLAGTEPREPCEQHRPAWTAVGDGVADAARGGGKAIERGGRRLFGWFGRLFR
jgi:penicillin-binding protein 1B